MFSMEYLKHCFNGMEPEGHASGEFRVYDFPSTSSTIAG
jgi:hypothetical protein